MKTKKSLLIAPALGVLLLAAAGSVSGTVAWFSAVRVFDTDVANFSVVETDGSLACVMNEGQGTTKVGERINVNNDTVLTHGSFDHNTGNAFVIDPDDNDAYLSRGTDSNAVAAADDSWIHKAGVSIADRSSTPRTLNVYNAISWSMTFTYTFASDATPVGIYLDLGESEFTPVAFESPYNYDFTSAAKDGDTAALNTAKGFRVAFYGGVNATAPNKDAAATEARNVVWGNNTPVTAAAYTTGQAYTNGTSKVAVDGIVYVAKEDIASAPADFDKTKWKPTGEIVDAGNQYVSAVDDTDIYNPDATHKDYVVHNPIVKPGEGYYKRIGAGVEHTTWATGERAERLCVLTPTNYSVTVKCAAWYEGTDPNVVTGSAMASLSAHISVYARTLGA